MASPDSLRVALEALHQAIADHPDPQSMQMLSQALQLCLKVQAGDYQNAQQVGGPRNAVASAIGGGQGGPEAMMAGGQ